MTAVARALAPALDPTRARRLGLAAVSACAVLLLLALVTSALDPGGEPMQAVDVLWALSLLCYPAVGAVVIARQPLNRIGWVYLAVGAAFTAAVTLSVVAELLAVRARPGAEVADRLSLVGFALVWALVTTFAILLLPDGQLPSRRWRPVGWAAGAALVACVALAVVPSVGPVVLAATGAVTVACLVSLVVRWRTGDGDDRRRLSWLVLAVLVVVVAAAVGTAGVVLDGPPWVGAAAEAAGQAAIPVGTGVAIVRSGLFDVEVVVDRAIVSVGLTVAVLGTYAAVVTVATRLVGQEAGQAAALLAAVAVAVGSGTLTGRLVSAVDRRLYGRRSTPYAVLTHVARDSAGAARVEELLERAARTVASDLRLPFVEVLPEPDASAHVETRSAVVVDVSDHGRREGVLVVGLRRGQRRFTLRETELLEDLARQLAVTMRAVRLAGEVQRSRERIVRAREDERQRIRRDLHDGLGPVLAAVGLQADTLRDHLAPDDTTGHVLLDRMGEGLRQGVSDVRRTVEGLRPPALDQIGLAAVVRAHALALDGPGLAVTTEVDDDLSAPAAVEVAAYRIVTEAMTNVARHAGARRCDVRVARDGDTLVVEVRDDGRGPSPSARPATGLGLGSMRERAEELGGHLVVEPRPTGGTVVRAVLPVGGRG